MRFIPYEKTFCIYDIVLKGPLFWCFSAGDAEAGFAMHPGLELDDGLPEPAPTDGSVVDISTMTPRQLNAYIKWFSDAQEPPPPLASFYDQMLHILEYRLLFDPKPDFMVGVWLRRILTELSIKDDRKQLRRAASLAHWAALRGKTSGANTRFGPWPSRNDLNAALSLTLKENSRLEARLALRVCRELLGPGIEMMPAADSDKAVTQFEREYNLRWQKGFPLKQPDVSFPLIHMPGHPYSTGQIRGKLHRFCVECWNFFEHPEQFDPLIQLWRTCQQQATPSARPRKRKQATKPST